jgi:hypothetical protein
MHLLRNRDAHLEVSLMSRVAVWLTNYASEAHLPRALESVLGQTFKDFTLYCFDNHSPGDAPKIIALYAATDPRIVVPEIPKGLAGIPLMDFCWRYLNGTEQDYTITIGGHDAWAQPEFLSVLVERMDAELAARGQDAVAILYTDTYQMNAADEIVGRYQDINQVGQIPRHFLPQVVVSTVNSPQLFGLWNDRVRRKIPIRYCCGGWDHLIVMEAALHGMIAFEGRVQLIMRCPPPTDNSEKYGQRHFSKENLARGQQDFIDQLEWCMYCVKKACEGLPPEAAGTYRMMLTASMAATYMTLRGTNLMQIPEAYQQFALNPLVIEAQKGLHHCTRFIDQLIKSAKPRT